MTKYLIAGAVLMALAFPTAAQQSPRWGLAPPDIAARSDTQDHPTPRKYLPAGEVTPDAEKPWFYIMHWDGDCLLVSNPEFYPDHLIAALRKSGGDAVNVTDPAHPEWPEFYMRLPSSLTDGMIMIRGETECRALGVSMRIVKAMPFEQRAEHAR